MSDCSTSCRCSLQPRPWWPLWCRLQGLHVPLLLLLLLLTLASDVRSSPAQQHRHGGRRLAVSGLPGGYPAPEPAAAPEPESTPQPPVAAPEPLLFSPTPLGVRAPPAVNIGRALNTTTGGGGRVGAGPSDAPSPPTTAPVTTQRPTGAPTNPPSNPPTKPPTDPPTDPPTNPPTDPPTDSPTNSPTNPPTDPPVPTPAPVRVPNNQPPFVLTRNPAAIPLPTNLPGGGGDPGKEGGGGNPSPPTSAPTSRPSSPSTASPVAATSSPMAATSAPVATDQPSPATAEPSATAQPTATSAPFTLTRSPAAIPLPTDLGGGDPGKSGAGSPPSNAPTTALPTAATGDPTTALPTAATGAPTSGLPTAGTGAPNTALPAPPNDAPTTALPTATTNAPITGQPIAATAGPTVSGSSGDVPAAAPLGLPSPGGMPATQPPSASSSPAGSTAPPTGSTAAPSSPATTSPATDAPQTSAPIVTAQAFSSSVTAAPTANAASPAGASVAGTTATATPTGNPATAQSGSQPTPQSLVQTSAATHSAPSATSLATPAGSVTDGKLTLPPTLMSIAEVPSAPAPALSTDGVPLTLSPILHTPDTNQFDRSRPPPLSSTTPHPPYNAYAPGPSVAPGLLQSPSATRSGNPVVSKPTAIPADTAIRLFYQDLTNQASEQQCLNSCLEGYLCAWQNVWGHDCDNSTNPADFPQQLWYFEPTNGLIRSASQDNNTLCMTACTDELLSSGVCSMVAGLAGNVSNVVLEPCANVAFTAPEQQWYWMGNQIRSVVDDRCLSALVQPCGQLSACYPSSVGLSSISNIVISNCTSNDDTQLWLIEVMDNLVLPTLTPTEDITDLPLLLPAPEGDAGLKPMKIQLNDTANALQGNWCVAVEINYTCAGNLNDVVCVWQNALLQPCTVRFDLGYHTQEQLWLFDPNTLMLRWGGDVAANICLDVCYEYGPLATGACALVSNNVGWRGCTGNVNQRWGFLDDGTIINALLPGYCLSYRPDCVVQNSFLTSGLDTGSGVPLSSCTAANNLSTPYARNVFGTNAVDTPVFKNLVMEPCTAAGGGNFSQVFTREFEPPQDKLFAAFLLVGSNFTALTVPQQAAFVAAADRLLEQTSASVLSYVSYQTGPYRRRQLLQSNASGTTAIVTVAVTTPTGSTPALVNALTSGVRQQSFLQQLQDADIPVTSVQLVSVEPPGTPSPPLPPAPPPPPAIPIAAASSSGALIGGIVGGIVGAVLLLALALFLYRRRRRRQQQEAADAKLTPWPDYKSAGAAGNVAKAAQGHRHMLADSDTLIPPPNGRGGRLNGQAARDADNFVQPTHPPMSPFAAMADTAMVPEETSSFSAQSVASLGTALSLQSSLPEVPWSDWEIKPEEIEICKRSDGRDWELGSGANGTVYKALRNGVQTVAVKLIKMGDEKNKTEFLREVAILKGLRDTNVVAFLGACLQEERTMLVMEYMAKGDLYHALSQDSAGTFSWYRRGRRIALDVARGLDHMHRRKLIHFDLKSLNILLASDGTAKIADVGLSKVLNRAATKMSGIGTWDWAAPELIMGEKCTEKVDIFSMGVVLWEICTGERPENRQLREISIPEEAPQAMADLVQRCRSANPADRPSAREIFDLIKAL